MRHSVSIIRGAIFIAAVGCLVGCPPSRVNPVTSRYAQTRYERLALGFRTSPPAVLFLELRDGKEPLVRQFRLDKPEEADLMPVDATIAGMVADTHTQRQAIVDAITHAPMGGRLEAIGVLWVSPAPPPVKTALGAIERRRELIVALADDASQVVLAKLGDAILPEADLWLTANGAAYVAVELSYPGMPKVRDLRVFEIARVDAQLALLRADQALERGADAEAKERLGFAAERVAPGDPLAAAIAFDRARVAARAKDVDACVAELLRATALDSRYREEAVQNGDFEGVRKEPRFVDFLMLAPH